MYRIYPSPACRDLGHDRYDEVSRAEKVVEIYLYNHEIDYVVEEEFIQVVVKRITYKDKATGRALARVDAV